MTKVMLASYSFYDGSVFGNMLQQWEQAGFFSYLLPFLLIFTLVNGILTQINLFGKNKGVNMIISLAVGFMALQVPFVSQLFAEIFPRLAVGLVILLVIVILVGMFIPDNDNGMKMILFSISAIIMIVVLVNTSDAMGLPINQTISENFGMFLGGLILIILFAIASGAGEKKSDSVTSKFFKNLSKSME